MNTRPVCKCQMCHTHLTTMHPRTPAAPTRVIRAHRAACGNPIGRLSPALPPRVAALHLGPSPIASVRTSTVLRSFAAPTLRRHRPREGSKWRVEGGPHEGSRWRLEGGQTSAGSVAGSERPAVHSRVRCIATANSSASSAPSRSMSERFHTCRTAAQRGAHTPEGQPRTAAVQPIGSRDDPRCGRDVAEV